MRIIAVLRPAEGYEDAAVSEIRRAFSRHSLIETTDPTESTNIIDVLRADMSEADVHSFKRTVQVVARHAVDGTVGSLSILENGQLLLRLRNPQLRQLVPNGHSLLHDLLTDFGADGHSMLSLTHCEIRERGGGHNEGFLFGEWRSGEMTLMRFMYGQKKAYFAGITLLFLVGLSLEVVLTLWPTQAPIGELLLRLSAPMLVSSSVLVLERLALWLDQRTPSLRWTPIRRSELASPLQASFDPHLA